MEKSFAVVPLNYRLAHSAKNSTLHAHDVCSTIALGSS